jgi:hypothetical protein
MVTLLPGFSAFRYPAKLLVVAALMLALLAGYGLDALTESRGKAARRYSRAALCLIGVSILIAAVAQTPALRQLPGSAAADATAAAIHTIVFLIVSVALVFAVARLRWARWAIALLVAIDVTATNRYLNALVPREIPAHRSTLSSVYRPDWADRYDSPRPFTLAELVYVDRQSLRPRYPLLSPGRRVAGSFASVEPYDLRVWKDELARLNDPVQDRVLASSGIQHRIEGVAFDSDNPADLELLVRSLDGQPRCWLTGRWEWMAPLRPGDAEAVRARTREVFESIARQDADHVTLECELGQLPSVGPLPAPFEEAVAEVLEDRGDRLGLLVSSPREALLVINDYWQAGWQVAIVAEDGERVSAPLLRANRIHRAVFVPAGRNRVVLDYRTPGLVVGAILSALTWALWVVVIVALIRRRRLQLSQT